MSEQQPCCDVPEHRPWLRVLGSFELRIPVGTGTHTTTPPLDVDERRLLALFAVTATPRSTSELATVLWPECSADVALGTLAGVCDSLADLRLVSVSGDTVALADHVGIDLVRALRRLRAWKRAPDAVESTAADQLVEALSEDLLPGWGEVWARQERERFRRVRLHALESLCRRLTGAGRHEPAIRAGMLVVAEEPLRESARRALIEAHLAAGNVSEAVKQYDAFVDTCAKFGIAPSADLSTFFPPSPAWPVLTVRRPIHLTPAVAGRGLWLEPPRRTQVVGAVGRG